MSWRRNCGFLEQVAESWTGFDFYIFYKLVSKVSVPNPYIMYNVANINCISFFRVKCHVESYARYSLSKRAKQYILLVNKIRLKFVTQTKDEIVVGFIQSQPLSMNSTALPLQIHMVKIVKYKSGKITWTELYLTLPFNYLFRKFTG